MTLVVIYLTSIEVSLLILNLYVILIYSKFCVRFSDHGTIYDLSESIKIRTAHFSLYYD